MGESKKPVWSPVAGQVVFALKAFDGTYQSPYGNRVYLKITEGAWAGCVLLFAHLETFSVAEGQKIRPFEAFAIMGMTGRGIDNVHLHTSLYPKGCPEYTSEWAIDPTPFFRAHGMPTNTAACNPWGSDACAAVLLAKGLKHEGIDFSGLDANIVPGSPVKEFVEDDLYKTRLSSVSKEYCQQRADAVALRLKGRKA